MTLTREYLTATLENLRKQEREILDAAMKARGAVMLAEAMLADIDKPVLTMTGSRGCPYRCDYCHKWHLGGHK